MANMENNVVLENCRNMGEYFHRFIVSTFSELYNNEFKSRIGNYDDIKVIFCSPSHIIFDKFCDRKGKITKETVVDVLREYIIDEYNQMMCSHANYELDENGCIHFNKVSVKVSLPCLHCFILMNIKHVETCKQYLQITLRHELGHLVDFARWEGKPGKDYMEYKHESDIVYDEYYKWNRENNFDVNEIEDLKRYHSIPMEAIADKFGGVSIEDFINKSVELLDKRKVDIEINLREIKGDEN